jgi:hypothetical protein
VRIYSAQSEEARRAQDLLKDWAGEGFISEEQHGRMERETVCELRTTNIFLRSVLFLFTLIIVGAAVGLFFTVFLSHPSEETSGVLLLIFAAISYAAAEVAVSRFHLYRYGIEEALNVCSVVFLCVGMQIAFFSGSSPGTEWLVFAAGALLSLWIWHRFGLEYAFPAAMIFVVFVPHYWTSSHWAQHVIVAAFYAAGLGVVLAVRAEGYSLAEAFLWLGVYLAINLKLSLTAPSWWSLFGFRAAAEFPTPFYWATWVLIWCLPPIVLARGIRGKDRFVMAAGGVTAVLTLVTNKPYLGWTRHSWDPMLLGALLIGVAVCIRRWLASGPGGIRYGFTAGRLSGKDKQFMSAGSTVFGMVSPELIARSTPASNPEVRFGGGDSGGGGATGEF